MTARSEVLAVLEALELPNEFRVEPYTKDPENVRGVLVMLKQEVIGRGRTQGVRAYGFSVFVLVGKTKPGPADDELDDAALDVLAALEQGTTALQVQIGDAERATFEDAKGEPRWPCYRIPLTVHTQKEATP